MSELRLYAITSKEVLKKMNGNRGKLAAQAGHAYLHAWWDADDMGLDESDLYRKSEAAAKIALIVDTDAELEEIHKKFYDLCTGLTKVVDAGRTCFNEPTLTFIGVGPITKENFEAVAPGLKLLL